jgi:UDPglucose 6-dehydrogenase
LLLSVLGAGYVGLVTAGCLAKLGNEVRCVDSDAPRVERLRQGELPIQEPGLKELVEAGTAAGRLSFHAEPSALRGTSLTIVAVGTLDAQGEWTADVVRRAVLAVARDEQAPRLVIIRSTLLPGTAASIAEEVGRIDAAVEIGHNPEFTREGAAVNDFLNPDRVVIGVRDANASSPLADALSHLYEPLGAPILITDLTSAETIKVASNVFLATKITFANELARLCAATGADVHAVVDGMGLDKRIGRNFLSPGPGFGGSCFPSQARALPARAAEVGVRTQLMSAVWPSNVDQAAWLVEQADRQLGTDLKGRRVTLLGLAFKAGTDDLRESPALRLAELFAARGASLALYDPSGVERAQQLLAQQGVDAVGCPDAVSACSNADVIVVATEWPEFHELDWSAIARVSAGRLVLDARNVLDAGAAARAGFEVMVLGVPAESAGVPAVPSRR